MTNCIYDTSATSLSKVEFGGRSENEMCLTPAYFYPKRTLTLDGKELPFQQCSYAFPKFKDSEKYFAVCGGFTDNNMLVATSNNKMGPIDDCNDLHRKFEKDYKCENSQVILTPLESDLDVRCDCPVIEKETRYGQNCIENRNSGWRKYRSVIIITICVFTIFVVLIALIYL